MKSKRVAPAPPIENPARAREEGRASVRYVRSTSGISSSTSVEDVDELGEAIGQSGWKEGTDRCGKVMTSFRKEAESDQRRLAKLFEKAEGEFRKAPLYDPTSGRHSFTRDSQGRFTQASRTKWGTLSKNCHDSLGRCEAALKAIANIADDYPAYASETEWVESIRREVRAARARVVQASGRIR